MTDPTFNEVTLLPDGLPNACPRCGATVDGVETGDPGSMFQPHTPDRWYFKCGHSMYQDGTRWVEVDTSVMPTPCVQSPLPVEIVVRKASWDKMEARVIELLRERDELRAEVERLEATIASAQVSCDDDPAQSCSKIVALRILQDLTDRSNAQARYRAEHARRLKAADEARKYRHKLYDFADALAEIAKDDGTPCAKIARAALDKEAWLGR